MGFKSLAYQDGEAYLNRQRGDMVTFEGGKYIVFNPEKIFRVVKEPEPFQKRVVVVGVKNPKTIEAVLAAYESAIIPDNESFAK